MLDVVVRAYKLSMLSWELRTAWATLSQTNKPTVDYKTNVRLAMKSSLADKYLPITLEEGTKRKSTEEKIKMT